MMPEGVNAWMTYAENDLTVAKHLFDTCYPAQYAIVCYHCQQAAEKAIKAIYIACALPGGVPQKHDLSFLLKQLKKRVSIPQELIDFADELNPYGVTTRYPSEITVDEIDADCAIRQAKAVLSWARETWQSLQ